MKNKSMIGLLTNPTISKTIKQSNINEDVLISYFGKRYGLKIPTPVISESIFREQTASLESLKLGIFGYHALQKYAPGVECEIFRTHQV